ASRASQTKMCRSRRLVTPTNITREQIYCGDRTVTFSNQEQLGEPWRVDERAGCASSSARCQACHCADCTCTQIVNPQAPICVKAREARRSGDGGRAIALDAPADFA